MDCPGEWFQPELSRDFDAIRSVRNIVTKALESARLHKDIKSSLEAEVVISVEVEGEQKAATAGGHLHTLLDKYVGSHHVSPVEFSLADILIISDVDLQISSRSDDIRQHVYSDENTVEYRGEAAHVKVSTWPVNRTAVPKHKCPRCWKYDSSASGELCGRCRDVCL